MLVYAFSRYERLYRRVCYIESCDMSYGEHIVAVYNTHTEGKQE
jgi:hypothetical protein